MIAPESPPIPPRKPPPIPPPEQYQQDKASYWEHQKALAKEEKRA